jgi:hypothetical protein
VNACVNAYAEDFITAREDVLLVMDTNSNLNLNASTAAVLVMNQNANVVVDCSRQDEQYP